MHDADARHLYVDVAEPLAERALLTVRGPGTQDPDLERRAASDERWRAQLPTSTARSISEAESQLERELRSGYRVVVAFGSRGEAERARYGLDRSTPTSSSGRSPSRPRSCSPRRRSPRDSSRRSCGSR